LSRFNGCWLLLGKWDEKRGDEGSSMPVLLRYDTIRLFEACVESLHIAVASLGSAKRVEFRQEAAAYAIEAGLLGTAAELAMSACLVQAGGPGAILWPTGLFKTAGAVLEDFRQLVSEATASTDFLTRDVDNPTRHRNDLLRHTLQFRRLIAVRAGGLHAGRGLTHEATVHQANVVADFLEALAKSSRIYPYLPKIPRCLWYDKDRHVVVEDLVARLRNGDAGDVASTFASIYLVLPDISNEQPDWLDLLDRVSVAPRDRDISYMLEVLENALPATLRRVASGAPSINVQVQRGAPHALPIDPQFLRRQFNEIRDQYHADVGNANGRLENSIIDLPPAEAIREIFAIGIEQSGILLENDYLSAHQAWPGIVGSLVVQGTPGPYWFLVRKTPDLGQLVSILTNVMNIAPRQLAERIRCECIYGTELIRDSRAANRNDSVFREILNDIGSAETNRESLFDAERRNRSQLRALPEIFREQLAEVSEGGQPVGPLLLDVLQGGCSRECLTYWPRLLAESAIEADDRPALIALLATENAAAGYTAAKKALRRIDFRLYGPAVEQPPSQ